MVKEKKEEKERKTYLGLPPEKRLYFLSLARRSGSSLSLFSWLLKSHLLFYVCGESIKVNFKPMTIYLEHGAALLIFDVHRSMWEDMNDEGLPNKSGAFQ